MYVTVAARPDIVCMYEKEHFKDLKRVLQYLKGTQSIGLVFHKIGKDFCLNDRCRIGLLKKDWPNKNRNIYIFFLHKFQ